MNRHSRAELALAKTQAGTQIQFSQRVLCRLVSRLRGNDDDASDGLLERAVPLP